MSKPKYNRSILPGGNVRVIIPIVLVLCLFLSAEVVKGDWESDANARIETNRKRDVEITVVDSNGVPVPDLNVDIQQIWHRFGFGTCLAYGKITNTNHQDFVLDHFEWAVCENEMKWESNERNRDVWEFTEADYIADWCATNDIVLRGHTLVWETGNQTPSWVSGLECEEYPTSCEMLEEIDERIDYTVGRYAGQIVSWDVDNEMLSGNMFECLGEAGRAHFFEEGNSIDPGCGFYMNEYSGNSFGGYNGDEYASRAQGLISLGAPVEGLGIQGHVESPFDPELYYSNVLNELDDLGLPIIATEFSVNNQYDEYKIATVLEDFYRICFSHPLVEAIIMWGYDEASWQWGGIVNSSTWTLNAGGVKYEDLMDEWTTTDMDITNGLGITDFRGFHGEYEITLSAPGQGPEVHEIELEPGTGTAEFELETSLKSPEPDYTPPSPDPTWASPPAATGPTTIIMTSTVSTDISTPVMYLFECTTDSDANSGWQEELTYEAEDLTPNTQYTFKVKARDNSSNHNETGWSEPNWATTDPPSTDVEIIGSWGTGTSHTKESGTNRALIFVAHVEDDDGAINPTSATYGGQSMTKVIDEEVGTGFRAYVVAYILNETGVAAATNSNFVIDWGSNPPDIAAYSSVFLQNVDHADLYGASDSSTMTASDTSETLTTSALSTEDGDMVIDAATCGNSGSFTVNNGFDEGNNQQFEGTSPSATGVTGNKSATGVNETPSVTHNKVNRMALLGFVVQAAPFGNLPPAAPTGLIATAGNETVGLDWNDNSEPDLAGYNVYRSTTSGGDPVPYGKLNGPLVTISEYVDDTVTNGIPYFYVVKAVDTNDLESVGYSNEDTATPDYQTCADVQAGSDGLLSDLDGDCYVDYWDLEKIAYYWLEIDCSTFGDCEGADFEPDDDVDFADFSTFGLQWLHCNNPEDASCTKSW